MQRFALKWIAIAVMALSGVACANEGVGDPCVPESVPCKKDDPTTPLDESTICGFGKTESYVESSSVQCRSRVCIVHKLIGGVDLGDPRDILNENEGIDFDKNQGGDQQDGPSAVDRASLDDAVYCTCRCRDGDGKKVEGCECGSGFNCEEILTLGGDGIRGSYCVRPTE